MIILKVSKYIGWVLLASTNVSVFVFSAKNKFSPFIIKYKHDDCKTP